MIRENERMLCVDIIPQGEKDQALLSRIGGQVARRASEKGGIFCLDDKWNVVRSSFRGGEEGALRRFAERQIAGEILGIDGIFGGTVNVAALVSQEEADRVSEDPSFYVLTNIEPLILPES